MKVYVVYKNPKDFPGKFVVRIFELHPTFGGVAVPEKEPASVEDTLREARRKGIPSHVFQVINHGEDDPVIVETWL